MSLAASTAVWERSRHYGTARLVLLAIAWRADPDGLAWPSMAELAERAGITVRQARRVVRELEASGELQVRHGSGRTHTSHYRILLNGDADVPVSSEERGTSEHLKGDIQGERGTSRVVKGDIATSPELRRTVTKNNRQKELTPAAPSTDLAVKRRDVEWEFVVDLIGEPIDARRRSAHGRIASDFRTLLDRDLNGNAEDPDARLAELRRRHDALAASYGEDKATARSLVNHWHEAGKMADGLMRPARGRPPGKVDQLMAHALEGLRQQREAL